MMRASAAQTGIGVCAFVRLCSECALATQHWARRADSLSQLSQSETDNQHTDSRV
jgi:hypothetical protein